MINPSEEARQKVKEIVDERIKELFESGKLKITVEDVANNSYNMSYDNDYVDLQIQVMFDEEIIYKQPYTVDIKIS